MWPDKKGSVTNIQEVLLQNGVHDDADKRVKEDGTQVLPSWLVEESLAPETEREIGRKRMLEGQGRKAKI